MKAISPDGAWLIYRKERSPDLWKMRTDGGAPTKLEFSTLLPGFEVAPFYSPDGKSLWIAGWKGEAGAARLGLEEFSPDGGLGIRRFELASVFGSLANFSRFQWAPGGDAVATGTFVDGTVNIWAQPLAGGAARPVTRFKSGHVLSFDWSTEGKRLFMMRGEFTTDIVLITDFR